MFLLAGFQNLALAGAPVPLRWVWLCFGVLFVVAGIWALMEGIGDIARAFAVRGLHRAG
jgi:hypothetical protein